MDFLNPKKRRAHRIRLLIGYVLIGVAIAFGTGILVLQAYGFDINRENGKVIQNGLVFVDSHPDSSNIYVNGADKGQTKQRLILPAGTYHIDLKRDGYRTWQRDFTLDGGGVEQMVYPFLFPTKFTPKDIQLYAAQPGMASQSPDRHWLVVQQTGKLDSFDVIDLNSATNNSTTITIPASTLTTKDGAHQLEAVEWSSDNRHLLLKHSFVGGYEYILIDRENGASSVNLNKLFAVPITKAALHDKQADQFYLLDAGTGTLRSAVTKSKVATPILEKIADFHPDGADQILYTTEGGASPNSVWVKLRNGNSTMNIRQIGKSSGYLLDMAKYDNHWYVTLGNVTNEILYIYKDPQSFDQKNKTLLPTPYRALRLDADPQFVSFSANAQFIALQGGSKFAVYDLEGNSRYAYDSELKLPAGYKVPWMDGNRLIASSDGVIVVFEFDNQNRQILVPGDAGVAPFFDRDYEVLYTIAPSTSATGRQALTRSQVKLKQ